MGALYLTDTTSAINASVASNNSNFQGNLPTNIRPTIANTALNAEMSFASAGAGIAPSISRLYLPAFIATELTKYGVDYAKNKYDEKFKELGLGKYAPVAPAPTTPPAPFSPPEDVVKPFESSSVTPQDTLISVLKNSTNSQDNIVNAIVYSNQLISDKIQTLIDLISTASDADLAYKDATLVNELSKNVSQTDEAKQALADEKQANDAYRDASLSSSQKLADSVKGLSEPLKALVDVTKRSPQEEALTSKKLEHITYETTPMSHENLGDTVPEMTPQQMRAKKDYAVAQKNSDENTFEMDEDDLLDAFGLHDITSVFTGWGATDRLLKTLNYDDSGHP